MDRHFRIWIMLCAFTLAACHSKEQLSDKFFGERQQMIDQQLKPRGIQDERVLAAVSKVPREEFVPENVRSEAYADKALPIGNDQTISQPFIVAYMTEQLRARPTDRVLEVGTGSGYQAAILAELVKDVYSIEIIEPLARDASARLARLGYTNAHVKAGDGSKGWPEVAPFDSIIVTCAPDHVPQVLTDQLKDGGRMIIPVGTGLDQQLYLLEKSDSRLSQRAILPVRFVQMVSESQKH